MWWPWPDESTSQILKLRSEPQKHYINNNENAQAKSCYSVKNNEAL